jgi:hypothetical protein
MTISIHFTEPFRVAKRSGLVTAMFVSLVMLSVGRADEIESSKISGKVTDAEERPIAGAEVYVNHYDGQPGPAEKGGARMDVFYGQ